MTKIFSLKLFSDGLSKTKVFGILSIIITTVLSAFISVTTVIEAADYATLQFIETDIFVPVVMVMLLLAPFSVYLQFNFLNKRASSDFYHSLPFTRIQLCVSFFASILVWVAAAILAPIILNSVVYSLSPWTSFDVASPFLCFIGYFCVSILLMGLMLISMSLTGTVISNILVFGIVSLFFRLIFLIMSMSFEEILPLVPSNALFGSYLSPEFFLPFRFFIGDDMFAEAAPIIYAFAVGVLCTVGGVILFNRRKSESADKSAISRIYQNIFRCAVSLPTTLLAVIIFAENALRDYSFASNYAAVILLIVTLFVYFIYEIITQKGISTIKKCIPQIFIVFGIAIALYGGIKLTEYNVLSYSPSADEIQSIQFRVDYDYSPSYEEINTSKIEIKDKEAFKLVEKALDNSIDASRNGTFYLRSNNHISLFIKDINGNKKLRYLTISQKDYEALMETFGSSAEFNGANLKIPTENEINTVYVAFSGEYNAVTSDMYKELWQCFTEEYNLLSSEEKLELKFSDFTLAGLSVSGHTDNTEFQSFYAVTEKLPKTFNMMSKTVHSQEKADELFQICSKFLESDGFAHVYADVTAYDTKNSDSVNHAANYFKGEGTDSEGKQQIEEAKAIVNLLSPYYNNVPTSGGFIVTMHFSLEYEYDYYYASLAFSVPEEIYSQIITMSKE